MPSSPGTFSASCTTPLVGRDHAGNPDDDAVEPLGRKPADVDEPPCEAVAQVEHAPDVGAAVLDVLAGVNHTLEVADRHAQEAGADVDAEHERCLRDRLEEERAVARALAVARRLAHQPRLEQRLQRERHGRLRDADAPD